MVEAITKPDPTLGFRGHPRNNCLQTQSDSGHVAIVAIANVAAGIGKAINSVFITSTTTELLPVRKGLLNQTL